MPAAPRALIPATEALSTDVRPAIGSLSVVETSGSIAAIEADALVRTFGAVHALDDVSLRVQTGEVHALLGPNGAGKTTLLRILSGLLRPTSGTVSVLGRDLTRRPRQLRRHVGLLPAGDRTFYLRISGYENLLFFARLQGLRRREASARAWEMLDAVGLADAGRRPVGLYSHGMQKRLAMARALLTRPAVLLVDEATHDLDPEGGRRIRELVRGTAESGAAVVWATQRLDEIRGFADEVTLIGQGTRRFVGTVPGLMELANPTAFLVRLQSRRSALSRRAEEVRLGGAATLTPAGKDSDGIFHLSLEHGCVIGDALLALDRAGLRVLTCQPERSEIEEAFLALTREQPS